MRCTERGAERRRHGEIAKEDVERAGGKGNEGKRTRDGVERALWLPFDDQEQFGGRPDAPTRRI